MQTTTLLLPDPRLTPEPVATPERFRSGHCHLELTPVWQYIVKKNRFPANVNRQEVFSELVIRLQHPEWQVRLHGTRVLAYIVPTVGSQLDALMSPTVLPSIITNLAHFSPALRSSSMDALLIYVQYSSDPEFVLKSMIVQGLDIPGAKSSLTVNVMECVPVVLQQIVKRNGDRPIAIPTFVHLVTALSNKMVQATFQQAAVYCLDRVKEIVGRNKFDHYLETFHPVIKKDFEVLCEVYRISSSSGQDSSVSSYEEEENDDDEVEVPKTPRRVTFGGERIKIRSPDEIDAIKPTGIPLPLKPALSMPKHPRGLKKFLKPSRPVIQTIQNVSQSNSFFNRHVDQIRPYTLPPLRQSTFKQFSNSQIGPWLGTPLKRSLDDRISFYKGYFSPHAILSIGRNCDSFNRTYENQNEMKIDESNRNLESPTKVTRPVFCMTVVPESKVDKLPATSATKLADVAKSEVEDKQQTSVIVKNQIESDLIAKPIYWRNNQDPDNSSKGRLDDINSMSYTTLAVTTEKPASNIKLYASSVDIQSLNNNDKPVAEVKPTKNVKPLEERKKSTTVLPKNIQRKSSDVQGSSLAPFDNPNRISELISVQISSNEWEAVVTGLQNISRLVMFHGKELRLNSFQPYGRLIAKHIRCLRSQVARAACTATQKIFTYVPKALEPDIEEIASALFPRTADTNKFLRVQSSEALNAMVDKVNPCKCVLVVAAKGVKHGNRLVRAEACRLLSKIVDKLGVNGTLYLPTEARDAVITSATSLVFDNTPSSRQAAQRILAKLSEDPRGASLISLAASPNVKATLNKSMSRIFLK
ncbi:uncharacterized protein LOC126900467 isoform X1 [Daktulosphaira vitifoliae]|uniref:uncharacterized protein LOC126900467 isoform X1 n=1 Tax=Daktulosphaira vitifoliae TaxID=58002 RepID=UPI0021A9D9A5|nr:uncharacterized protein LOC126900467 isoform X1 [Daktulosphaira vitifoliae]